MSSTCPPVHTLVMLDARLAPVAADVRRYGRQLRLQVSVVRPSATLPHPPSVPDSSRRRAAPRGPKPYTGCPAIGNNAWSLDGMIFTTKSSRVPPQSHRSLRPPGSQRSADGGRSTRDCGR
jgi:hypothetical protein